MNTYASPAPDGGGQGQLLNSPLCHNCLELHDHACTPLSNPLPDDAMSLPPRFIKSEITGALSLHQYRKFLSKSADRIDDLGDHAGKKLKRKPAALHLYRPPALDISYPVSVSSASTPPPLSPSYSHSIISQQSEEPEIGEAQPVRYQPQSPRVTLVSDNGTRARPNRKRLNTFREKVQKRKAEADARKAESDSMLASTQAAATVSHGGACFEILNPRKSLDLARIVSYIEDVDSCSILSDHDATYYEQGLDRVSISQFTDATLPSFYSSPSLYSSLDPSTPKGQDIPSSSPGVRDRIRSLSDFSLHDGLDYWTRPVQTNSQRDGEVEPHTPITSTREEFNHLPDLSHSSPHRPSTPSTQTFCSDSEIGEPGSPVYANGEWAQVEGRDRGIFYELEGFDHHPSPSECSHGKEETSPHETPFDTPLHSPISPISPFGYKYDPYDPVYFDPHVQSVLAAANAESMGLRGTRQSDGAREFQRRKSDERKPGHRRGLKKLFSWRPGST